MLRLSFGSFNLPFPSVAIRRTINGTNTRGRILYRTALANLLKTFHVFKVSLRSETVPPELRSKHHRPVTTILNGYQPLLYGSKFRLEAVFCLKNAQDILFLPVGSNNLKIVEGLK